MAHRPQESPANPSIDRRLEGKKLLPTAQAFYVIIYLSACQTMSAEFIFYLLSHSLIIIFAPSRAITRRA
jgi:hypothetical protein